MSTPHDRGFRAVNPGGMGATGVATAAVAAPVGALSPRQRHKAAQTALDRTDPAAPVLVTAIPGTYAIQQQLGGGRWQTLVSGPVTREGRTPIPLPADESAAPGTYRVAFTPKNPHLPLWVGTLV